jgi:hypothetical protein
MNILDHFPRKSTNGSSDEISVAVRHGDCGRAWVAQCGAQSNQEIETNQAFIFFSDRSPQPQPYLSLSEGGGGLEEVGVGSCDRFIWLWYGMRVVA